MTTLHFHTALPDTDSVPGWVHLLPAGTFNGVDGRGPYHVADASAVITHSMRAGKLPIDENHATDRAAVTGGEARAVGWIVEMQSREDGLWGRVSWTKAGRALVSDHAYRGISPAFRAPGGAVSSIERASLTNLPNLTLTSLHNQEPRMDLAELRRRLRLADTATQADVERALDRAGDALQLHTQAAQIAGLSGTPDAATIVTGLRAKVENVSTHAAQVTALQAQVTELREGAARTAAEHALETASAEGTVISEPMRAHLIDLHMRDANAAGEIIKGLPKVGRGVQLHSQRGGSAARADDADVAAAAKLWGQKPEDLRGNMRGAA